MEIAADALTEILLRLPPSERHRARLVCKLWRDVIGERTMEMQSRAEVLLWHPRSAVAYVVDDMSSSSTGSYRELWSSGRRRPTTFRNLDNDLQLVGTCNGLLCIVDNDGQCTGIRISIVNPATKEKLSIPPLPCAEQCSRQWRWDKTYSFAYHPTTGRYKVVHVPCAFDRVCRYDTARVFTLGQKGWRVAPAPGSKRCDLTAGIVSVDGVTHWVRDADAMRIVSFDLDNEVVAASTIPFPNLPARPDDYNLAEVHGRLGLVIRNPAGMREAWVREEERWTRRYILTCSWHDIPRPHFAYGEYFLKTEGNLLYRYPRKGTLSSFVWRLPYDVVKVSDKDRKMLVAKMNGEGREFNYRTFSYVKTSEPLRVYDRGK